jgi:hypothetical protein
MEFKNSAVVPVNRMLVLAVMMIEYVLPERFLCV